MGDMSEFRGAPLFDDLAAAHPHLLMDLHVQSEYIHRAKLASSELRRTPGPKRAPAHGSVSLAQWQTPIRSQEGRGTCYAFGTIAAMEAAYRRDHGVTLDLSEQYAFHINKMCELLPDYPTKSDLPHDNNTSYGDGQGASDLVMKLVRMGVCAEEDAPYRSWADQELLRTTHPACGDLGEDATQDEFDAFELLTEVVPVEARRRARYRVTAAHEILGKPSVDTLRTVINDGHEVVVDIPGHCYLIVGYDDDDRVFLVKNSWNEETYVRAPYSTDFLWAHYLTGVTPPTAPPHVASAWLGRWNMDHDGWRGELVIRRITNFRDAPDAYTRLGTYHRGGREYAVNGRTEDDGRCLHFWIADTAGYVKPGALAGQEFRVYLFVPGYTKAAGWTTWKSIPFGVSLSRDALPGTPSEGFDITTWLGDWRIVHDNWAGRLSITSVDPLQGTYQAKDGTIYDVTGRVSQQHPHMMIVRVPFQSAGPQPFHLHGHTREGDIFSGTTYWSGNTYGVQGHRL